MASFTSSSDTKVAYFASLTHTGAGIHVNFFPLASGLIASYAKQEIKNLECEVFNLPDDLVASIENKPPQILGLSNYVWNINLSCLVAAYAKRVNPSTIVVFGGPNFPLGRQERAEFLSKRPEIDFYIRWDGEQAFVDLFMMLEKFDFDVAKFKSERIITDNCSYLDGEAYIEGPDSRLTYLSDMPSPYTTGLFDRFFEQSLVPLIETTRGCPYSCVFCNDGGSVRSKIIRRSKQDIGSDLEYIASRVTRSNQLTIADLNFGQYPEDIETSEQIAGIIKRYNWPQRVETAVGKAHPERILECVKIVNSASPGAFMFGASFQSTDAHVLTTLRRKNVPFEKLLALVVDKNADIAGAFEYATELILGLPNDNFDTHCQTLRDVVDVLGMNVFIIFQLILLNGTELATPAFREEHELRTRHRVYVGCVGKYKLGDSYFPCVEVEEIVVGTKTMSWDDYIKCRILGLLLAIYIDNEQFKEIFGLIKRLKLSIFDLILHICKNYLNNYAHFKGLIDSFIRDNSAWTFATREDLDKFIFGPGVVEKYAQGEYGKNEMLYARARAYQECSEDVHSVLLDATISFINLHGCLTAVTEAYLREAAIFSRLRKFDLKSIADSVIHTFNFDFKKAEIENFEVDPVSLQTAPYKIKFYHDLAAIERIEGLMRTWGSKSDPLFSKMIRKANLKLIARRAEKIL
jgi:tRNA A37 methylthiotransferase MiaB